MAADAEIARAIQAALLPEVPSSVRGWEVAHVYRLCAGLLDIGGNGLCGKRECRNGTKGRECEGSHYYSPRMV